MKEHFLDDLRKEVQETSFFKSVEKNINNISNERVEIGKKIKELIAEGVSKKQILDKLSSNTFLSSNSIMAMIEEFDFNSFYKVNFNIQEIRIIKKIFKIKKMSEEEKKIFVLQDDIKMILMSEYQLLEENKKNKFSHTFFLEENGESLFRTLKKHFSKELGKKISNSELIYYSLMELYNSFPIEEIQLDLELQH